MFFISKSPGDYAIYCRNARVLEMQNFTPAYMNGWTYVRMIFSEPKFLGCIDYQIFLPMWYSAASASGARALLLIIEYMQTVHILCVHTLISNSFLIKNKLFSFSPSILKLITNRWAWALVPTKLVEPGNALAWRGGIHGNPASGPHQAPSHWTIQWNTYRPNTYLAPTNCVYKSRGAPARGIRPPQL